MTAFIAGLHVALLALAKITIHVVLPVLVLVAAWAWAATRRVM